MWDIIEERGRRYEQLTSLLSDPESPAKPGYPGWLREHGRLTKFGALWATYCKAKADLEEAQKLLAAPDSDADLKALAASEQESAQTRLEEARRTLVDAELNDEDDSSRNVILEIHHGTGGEEAKLFVADLYEMYRKFAERHGWKVTELELASAEMGGLKEVSCRVEGEGAYGRLRFEAGGHRVQRVPKTETQGRIHTSLARVAVLPEAEEVDVQVDPKDVRETFCTAGGPGGQNVNKVASQCQLSHLPSGILVRCMETRSAAQNRVRAWQILRSKLYAIKKAEAEKSRSDQRLGQIGSGERSERVRTYNFPQGRVTDHRLEGDDKNWPIQEIMSGALDGLIDKLEEVRRGAGKEAR